VQADPAAGAGAQAEPAMEMLVDGARGPAGEVGDDG
jgi:hypothetical protein